MIRSIPVLVSAILLSHPTMPKPEAARYATVLNQVALEHDFDPLTAVAIIHFETHWRPALISPDGEDYGLGQVRGRYLAACRSDEDPVGAPSAACQAAKSNLLDGAFNIRRMATIITANREMCRERTGTAWAPQWLAGYQGYNSPSNDRWCSPGDKTWRVLEYRKELMATLLPKPKPRVAAKSAPGKAPAKAPPSPPRGGLNDNASSPRTPVNPAPIARSTRKDRSP
ncbi:MAG: hypothetical protein ABJE95_37695 [Byssovorax sp.]